ncbi:putative ribosome biogenesis protein RLP24 [Cardamine amara subsp. amara]|uniref:Ribosome biogenesis protein RLP24 n=1 Tax=Cardamine amara subsp. amara TaxID=228776 RepID=A0ABD1C6Z7_CARAN
MRLVNCWFCSSTIYPGHGIQFVRNDAKIFRFCRSKCHKNFKMKRNPRKVKWTKAYRAAHGKDMTKDTTFEFEKKRNRPERYDRNVTENTLLAIKKIVKIRDDRATKHIQNRLKPDKKKKHAEAIKELDNNIHLVRAPQPDSEKIKVDVPNQKSVQNEAMEE